MLDVPDFNASIEDPPRPSNAPAFWRFVVVIALVSAAVFGMSRHTGRAARVAAADRAAGVKPTLLMFTADWCGPCQAFKGSVLADDRVFNRLHETCNFEKVDLTKWEGKNAAVATEFGVRSIPTLILVNSKGQEFGRYDGPHDVNYFAAWIDRHTR